MDGTEVFLRHADSSERGETKAELLDGGLRLEKGGVVLTDDPDECSA